MSIPQEVLNLRRTRDDGPSEITRPWAGRRPRRVASEAVGPRFSPLPVEAHLLEPSSLEETVRAVRIAARSRPPTVASNASRSPHAMMSLASTHSYGLADLSDVLSDLGSGRTTQTKVLVDPAR